MIAAIPMPHQLQPLCWQKPDLLQLLGSLVTSSLPTETQIVLSPFFPAHIRPVLELMA